MNFQTTIGHQSKLQHDTTTNQLPYEASFFYTKLTNFISLV